MRRGSGPSGSSTATRVAPRGRQGGGLRRATAVNRSRSGTERRLRAIDMRACIAARFQRAGISAKNEKKGAGEKLATDVLVQVTS